MALGPAVTRPRLAILFWFYKELEVCRSRLTLLRRLNPGVSIYGLYGGPPGGAPHAEAALGALMDDFYAYPGGEDAHWKWINGDHLLAAWARERGGRLSWDTVVVVQWDLLILAPVAEVFAMLEPDEALFSGYRPVAEIESWWGWARRDQPERRAKLERFTQLLLEEHGYAGPLFACLFIVICLPRRFLERYAASGPPAEGFLEYRTPTLARVFGTPVRTDHPFRPWWASDPATREAPPYARLLSAAEEPVGEATIRGEVARTDGGRVFHPYRQAFALH